MATQYPPACNMMTVSPHAVAMPYRGDGVACALRQTFPPDDEYIPVSMLRLLAAIDAQRAISDPD